MSTEELDSKRLRLEMKNINVTKKGLLSEEDFESMLIQLRAEYAKAVANTRFINVTKKGLLSEEDFESMLIQLRAEYAKAVANTRFIVELLEKTRDNRAPWNEEKLEKVSYNIIERVLCLDTDLYVSYHLFGMKIYT